MDYLVPEETLNKILTYLSTKPFNEVAPLIQLIQGTSKKFEPNAPTEEMNEIGPISPPDDERPKRPRKPR